jgi:hypothetical protein
MVVLFIMVSLTNLANYWILNNILFEVINWYNKLNIFFELLLFIIGGSLFFSLIALFSNFLSFLNGVIFYWFPSNILTLIISLLVFFSNTAYCIKILWSSMGNFTILSTLEFIVLCLYLISVNYIFINRHYLKERNG